MAANRQAIETVKEWYDRLETAALAKAEIAGLLGHRTSIGKAREVLVEDVLKTFLPDAIGYGSGEVLHKSGMRSKQIDVILYDRRFPRFELPGAPGVYLAEGVIAAIEVKSVLDAPAFRAALDNCASVIPTEVSMHTESLTRRKSMMPPIEENGVLTDEFLCSLLPRTYIFGFRSTLTPESAQDIVIEKFKERGKTADWDVRMPRVVVAGEVVGVFCDSWHKLGLDEAGSRQLRSRSTASCSILSAFWRTNHRLGLLAIDLTHAAVTRLAPAHGAHDVRYAFEQYLPSDLYSHEMLDKHAVLLANYWEQVGERRRTVELCKVHLGEC